MNNRTVIIDAAGLNNRQLNQKIRRQISGQPANLKLINVNGQRYIAAGISQIFRIEIFGIPGNDLGAFMNGPEIYVHNNAQEAVGNTMSGGKIVIFGDAGDIVGYGMRGGKIYIAGDIGYRCGIHIKEYQNNIPLLIVGGKARDFFGEYLAGGVLILLGLNSSPPVAGNYLATGIHGGKIYLRKQLPKNLGPQARAKLLTPSEKTELAGYLKEYCQIFKLNPKDILGEKFYLVTPKSHRPYGHFYAY